MRIRQHDNQIAASWQTATGFKIVFVFTNNQYRQNSLRKLYHIFFQIAKEGANKKLNLSELSFLIAFKSVFEAKTD